MKYFYSILIFLHLLEAKAQSFELIPFAGNLRRPVDISHAGDDRLFITEKDGSIVIINKDGSLMSTPYLDIRNRVNAFANERGLLGLAFHPDYKINGYFYVHYTNSAGNSVISRFQRNNTDINKADASSEKILLTILQPASNHNAGDLNFGPDGYLYIGMGDGGDAGDPGNRSQNPKNLLGKMLRINVNQGNIYDIPADNPFKNNPDTLEEIWSLGLRNPWRFSFDRLTGDMWIADVGQNAWEEINMEEPGLGGHNYGWRCYEGNAAFNTSGCRPREHYRFPVHVYPNRFDVGCSVTGGYVYRGSNNPSLYGKYIYADFCTGIFWALQNVDGIWKNEQLANLTNQDFVSFGEDVNGELYVAGLASGVIYKISDGVCKNFNNLTINSNSADPLCHDECSGSLEISGEIQQLDFLWNDNVRGPARTDLCSGAYTVSIADSFGCSSTLSFELLNPPVDTVFLTVMNDTIFVLGSNSVNYLWYLENDLIAETDVPIFLPEKSGVYAVQTTSEKGCIITSAPLHFILSSTHEIKNTQEIILIGNPVTNQSLVWKTARNVSTPLYILNADGKLIERFSSPDPLDDTYSKSVSNLASGSYILVIGNRAKRFIVMH
jgi:glucose/arabinose dehydrogenase